MNHTIFSTHSFKRAMRLAIPLTLALAATACVVAPAYRYPPGAVYNPPPAVSETPPATGNWVPGHYVFREGAGWVWVPGHYAQAAVPAMPAPIVEPYVVAPGPGYVWVRGYWGWGGARWHWHGGRWVVRGRF